MPYSSSEMNGDHLGHARLVAVQFALVVVSGQENVVVQLELGLLHTRFASSLVYLQAFHSRVTRVRRDSGVIDLQASPSY